jgi:hypothetical protein
MVPSASRDPLALVRRISTTALAAVTVGSGAVALHLAGDHATAIATAPATAPATQSGSQSGSQQGATSSLPPDQPGGQLGFTPVGPLQGGAVPQAGTRGS